MNRKIIFALLVAIAVPAIIFAQDQPAERLTIDDLVSWTNALYGSLVVVWGFLAKPLGKYLPALEKMQPVFKVLAGAVVLAGAFVVSGIGQVLPLLFYYLSAMGFYDLFLKPFIPKK